MASLRNKIILSMPHMQDPYFYQAVIFICEHNADGALGFIINKPFGSLEMQKLFKNYFPEENNILKLVPTLYFGGPVSVEQGILLHSSDYETDGTIKNGDEFSFTSNTDIIQDIANGSGPKDYKLLLGHSGWAPNQLEAEIENGDWLLHDTNPKFVFHTDETLMWNMAAKSFGFDMSSFSGHGGLA